MGLFLIISGILGIAAVIAIFLLDDADFPFKVLLLFAGLVLSMTISMAIMKAVNTFTEPGKSKYIIELVNLNSDTMVSGEAGGFIIFNGYMEEKPYYFFMKKTNDGGYTKEKLPADNSVIYEVEGLEQPYVEVYTSYKESTFWYIDLWDEVKETKFYVPKGTIVKKFEIN